MGPGNGELGPFLCAQFTEKHPNFPISNQTSYGGEHNASPELYYFAIFIKSTEKNNKRIQGGRVDFSGRVMLKKKNIISRFEYLRNGIILNNLQNFRWFFCFFLFLLFNIIGRLYRIKYL
jgi:hypothetical protein